MTGFSNPIIGGGGSLVYPSIHSPNFVHGSSGWSINKDGSAEFQNVVLPTGSGGNVITISASIPSSPGVTRGDLWFYIPFGYQDYGWYVWDGSAWQGTAVGQVGPNAVSLSSLNNTVTARALGGVTTTISASAPSSPVTGDIWIDELSSGPPPSFLLKQWNGSSWVPLTANANDVINAGTITATLIAAGTITAGQLAAGIVYAGIVNSTEVDGAIFRAENAFGATIMTINKASGTWLLYADLGSSSQGSLVSSGSQGSGTDEFGNSYLAGVCSYGTDITQIDNGFISVHNSNLIVGETSTSTAANVDSPSTGIIAFYPGQTGISDSNIVPFAIQSKNSSGAGVPLVSVAGALYIRSSGAVGATSPALTLFSDNTFGYFLKYIIPGPSQWQVGANVLYTTGTQQFTGTGQVTVTGLSVFLPVGKYLIRVKLFWIPSGTIASAHNHFVNFSGSGTFNFGAIAYQANSTSTINQGSGHGTAFGIVCGSPTHLAFLGWTEIEGIATINSTGTLTVDIALITGGDDVTTQPGSYLEVRPLS